MYAIGLSIAKLPFTSEETRPKVYLLFDIKKRIKAVILILDMIQYILSNIIQ